MLGRVRLFVRGIVLAAGILALGPGRAPALLNLGPEEFVQSGGADIVVTGYSVPSLVDVTGDGLADLIVGEGSGSFTPKVRIYTNVGSAGSPAFSGYFFAQANGADLTVTGSGCLGLFPRAVYWDADGLRDLVIGTADGKVKAYLNIGTPQNPTFDAGSFVQCGEVGAKVDIDVGDRATPMVVDWDSDGLKDLVVGALGGKVNIFFNCGCSLEIPEFIISGYAQQGASDLSVPSGRSSPDFVDVNGDGKKDLLTGNTNGELLQYLNVGSVQYPNFGASSSVESNGVPIDLAGTLRSRPFACDWNGDGILDVLIGYGDGKVRLYRGVWVRGDANTDLAVDGADYTIWADHYQSQPVAAVSRGGWAVGNFNEDDVVDGADYTIWADNYGAGGQPVPEPSVLVMILGAAGLLGRRRSGPGRSGR